jgi:hypothetical protein
LLGHEGVKIIIPQELYSEVLERLDRYRKKDSWYAELEVEGFLAYRCSGIFLQRYYTEIDDINLLPSKIRSLASFDKSLSILCRLNTDGLLAEPIRKETVKYIQKVSIKKTSADFLDEKIVGSLLAKAEKQSLWKILHNYVFSNKEKIIEDIQYSWDGESAPDFLFDDLITTLEKIVDQSDDEEVDFAEDFLGEVGDVISCMEDDLENEAEYENLEAEETTIESVSTGRSIFDDVDE